MSSRSLSRIPSAATVGRFGRVFPSPKSFGQEMTMTFHVTLPSIDDFTPEFHFAPLLSALWGIIGINRFHIRKSLERAAAGLGVPIPPLYLSGVRYQEDPPKREDWRDVYSILSRGVGDCDNLVGWRTAELLESGIPAEPVIKWQHLPREVAISVGYPGDFIQPQGLWVVHCSVRHLGTGMIEDVSKNLGMGGNFTSQV